MKRFLKPKLIFPLVTMVMLLGASFAALAGNLIGTHAQAATGTIKLTVSGNVVASAARGTSITAVGSGFPAGDVVSVKWVPTGTFLKTTPSFVTVGSDGKFTATFTIPSDAALDTFADIQFRIEDHHPPIIIDKLLFITLLPLPTLSPTQPHPHEREGLIGRAECHLEELECDIILNHDNTELLRDIVSGTPLSFIPMQKAILSVCAPFLETGVGTFVCATLAEIIIIAGKQKIGEELGKDQGKGIIIHIKLKRTSRRGLVPISFNVTPR